MTPLRQRMIEDMRIRKFELLPGRGSNGCHSLSLPQEPDVGLRKPELCDNKCRIVVADIDERSGT